MKGVSLCLREGSWGDSRAGRGQLGSCRGGCRCFDFFALNLPSTAFPFTVLISSFVLSGKLLVFTRRCINILPHGEATSDLRGHLATSSEC